MISLLTRAAAIVLVAGALVGCQQADDIPADADGLVVDTMAVDTTAFDIDVDSAAAATGSVLGGAVDAVQGAAESTGDAVRSGAAAAGGAVQDGASAVGDAVAPDTTGGY